MQIPITYTSAPSTYQQICCGNSMCCLKPYWVLHTKNCKLCFGKISPSFSCSLHFIIMQNWNITLSKSPLQNHSFSFWVMVFWEWKCEMMKRLEYALTHSYKGYTCIIIWVKIKSMLSFFMLARLVSNKCDTIFVSTLNDNMLW